MAIFLKNKSEETPWMSFTDIMVGLFTLFVFCFIVVWVKKVHFEKEFVLKNEAFTRKESEYKTCVEEKKEAQNKLINYQTLLDKELSGAIEKGLLAVTDGKIDIQASLLFATAKAGITPEGEEIIKTVSTAFKNIVAQDTSFMIMVSGYTDNVPISSPIYSSNWELSGARSTNVVKHMIANGFPEGRLFAAGFGEFHPKVPNSSESNRALNRRVEIVRVPITQNQFSFSKDQ